MAVWTQGGVLLATGRREPRRTRSIDEVSPTNTGKDPQGNQQGTTNRRSRLKRPERVDVRFANP